MKNFLAALVIFITIFIIPSHTYGLTLYNNEFEAQCHCPNDVIVWLNLPTKIWHPKGGRWYGTTNNGSYVCKNDAASSGCRGSLNGQ